jgi:hypothetical protein
MPVVLCISASGFSQYFSVVMEVRAFAEKERILSVLAAPKWE